MNAMLRQSMPDNIGDPDMPIRNREIRMPLPADNLDKRTDRSDAHAPATLNP